jgi:hypothetical protein
LISGSGIISWQALWFGVYFVVRIKGCLRSVASSVKVVYAHDYVPQDFRI